MLFRHNRPSRTFWNDLVNLFRVSRNPSRTVTLDPNYALLASQVRVKSIDNQTSGLLIDLPNSPAVMDVGLFLVISSPRVGDLRWSASPQVQDGDFWMVCDGRALDRRVFTELFQVITYMYGMGETNDFFLLPNASGKTMVPTRDGRVPGTLTGQEEMALGIAQLPAHTHLATSQAAGGHKHTYNDAYFAEYSQGGGVFGTSANTDTDNSFRYRTASGGFSSTPSDLDTSTAASHTHPISIASTGMGQAFSMMQPTLYIGRLLIYTGRNVPDLYR